MPEDIETPDPAPAEVMSAETFDPQALKVGNRGYPVILVQQRIGVAMDGNYGPETEEEVKRRQKAQGLPETGVVDRATARAFGLRWPVGQ